MCEIRILDYETDSSVEAEYKLRNVLFELRTVHETVAAGTSAGVHCRATLHWTSSMCKGKQESDC